MLLTQLTRDTRHLAAALKTAVDHVRSYAAPSGVKKISPCPAS